MAMRYETAMKRGLCPVIMERENGTKGRVVKRCLAPLSGQRDHKGEVYPACRFHLAAAKAYEADCEVIFAEARRARLMPDTAEMWDQIERDMTAPCPNTPRRPPIPPKQGPPGRS